MAGEPLERPSATIDPAAPAKERVSAKGTAATDSVCWEFRLTADARRILIQVNEPIDPEFV